MKNVFTQITGILILIISQNSYAQVGIGTTTPNAQIDIVATNQTTPANTDGILIPRIDAFPASNPGANQNAMLVYLTTTSGSNPQGFYYWDNATTAWLGFLNNIYINDGDLTADRTVRFNGNDLTFDLENGNNLNIDNNNGDFNLNNGHGFSGTSKFQMLMGYGSASMVDYRHGILSRHNSSGSANNALDFFLWSPLENSGSTQRPRVNVLSLADDEVVLNEDSHDIHFRVESNTDTHALYVDANTGNVGIGESSPTNALLEIDGNLIVGNTFTGGTGVAQTGGATIEGRTIVGEDDFYYAIDKFVVYGNTTISAGSATNGDNGNGLHYAVNGYTSGGTGVYGEDNDGGTGIEGNVDGGGAGLQVGAKGYDISGNGTGVEGISADDEFSPSFGNIGVHGIESTTTGWAVLGTGDIGSTTNGFLNASDRRLKRNIEPLKNALDIINTIQPKSYEMRWNEEKFKYAGFDRTRQMGFIAQELEQVLPNVVKEKTIPLSNVRFSKKGLIKKPELSKVKKKTMDIKMVNYIQMIPLLTQAIKEQQEIIKALEARIKKLEN